MNDGDAFLEVDGIHKRYGQNSVLRGCSGRFEGGRIAAIVGPNGAGKTTLLRIIAGLQQADSGAVRTEAGIMYYGGPELLPVKGTIDRLRQSLGQPSVPNGSRRLSTLSRGELHLAALDIVFAMAPGVLLLDEPWTALEPDAREALNHQLDAFVKDRVVICSTHDLDEVARVADDVLFLSNGIAMWQRREAHAESFRRDELMRVYRERKLQR